MFSPRSDDNCLPKVAGGQSRTWLNFLRSTSWSGLRKEKKYQLIFWPNQFFFLLSALTDLQDLMPLIHMVMETLRLFQEKQLLLYKIRRWRTTRPSSLAPRNFCWFVIYVTPNYKICCNNIVLRHFFFDMFQFWRRHSSTRQRSWSGSLC